ncbi:MAG: hypothetical protein AMXMBFR81_16100 [Chthonomonas sp.]
MDRPLSTANSHEGQPSKYALPALVLSTYRFSVSNLLESEAHEHELDVSVLLWRKELPALWSVEDLTF